MKKTYQLKTIALARLLAEITVFLLLVSTPFAYDFLRANFHLDQIPKGLFIAVAVIAAFILASYGFVTYKVCAEDAGISVVSLFKRHFIAWSQITGFALQTNWGFRRYVITYNNNGDSGSTTFPLLLSDIRSLTELIRNQLRVSEQTNALAQKVYCQDFIGVLLQLISLLLSLFFIVVFWVFCVSLFQQKGVSVADRLIIIGATLLFTIAMLARTLIFALMPMRVELDSDGIKIQRWFGKFGKRAVSWQDIKSVNNTTAMLPALFLPALFMPEGLLLKTNSGWFFFGSRLSAYDELEEALSRQLSLFNDGAIAQAKHDAKNRKSREKTSRQK